MKTPVKFQSQSLYTIADCVRLLYQAKEMILNRNIEVEVSKLEEREYILNILSGNITKKQLMEDCKVLLEEWEKYRADFQPFEADTNIVKGKNLI